MTNLDLNLEKVEKILGNLSLNKDLYMRIYSFTTENINGYLDLFNFKNRNLLTVGSSGDQVLNGYYKGCQDITLLDINPFAKYYVYLKIAAIMALDYNEFIEFFFRWIDMKYNVRRYNSYGFKKLSSILKTLDYDSYCFFEYLLNNYTRNKISDYLMIDDQDNNSLVIKQINNYLQSEDSYNKFKNILKDINFNFINQNIFNFQSNTKYDNIFLSNLCSIKGLNLYQFRDLLTKLKENNLSINGSMLIAYLWNMDFNSNEINFEWKQVYNMPATRFLLEDFITEYYNITGIDDITFNRNLKSDLVMIYKKSN